MKRLLFIMAVCIAALVGCSKEAPQQSDEAAEKIAAVLTGHFKSQIETLGNIEYEEITFNPYASPKETVSLFGTFNAYGTAQIVHYYGDHLLETGGTYLYSIDGQNSCVSFYGYDGTNVTKGEDRRVYIPVSITEFKLKEYGSTIIKSYSKQ